MWNEQLSLKLANLLKRKYNCLIIFGGPSCPHNPTEYFRKYKFIDIAVRAEGEEAFNQILLRYIDNKKDFRDIPNVSFRNQEDKCIINTNPSPFNRDLDIYPSPYLTGEFEYLFSNIKNHNYQIIIETNRGCPFLCTYCYWGKGGNNTKYKFHSLERVFSEIDWIAKKKIKYVFNADSNFGMHRRDMDIAQKLVDTKINTGYPEKFRTCWGKNTSEQIFKIASLLNLYDLEKGITLARQTNSKQALLNVKRDNIKLSSYSELEQKFNKLKIPVYAEMILGLPGETNESWKDGLCEIIETSIENHIFVYQAEIYPNTEFNEKYYREKYKIKSKKIKLNEIHCSPRDQDWLQEYQDIVIANSTMTKEDWKKRNIFAITLIVIHSFKLGFYFLYFFHDFMKINMKDIINGLIENANEKDTPFFFKNCIKEIELWLENILKGEGRGILNKKYSDVFLDIEEVVALNLFENLQTFYKEINFIFKKIIGEKKYNENLEIINEITKYQLLRMPNKKGGNVSEKFNYNIPEYMFYINSNPRIKIKKKSNEVKSVNTKNYESNYHQFTKEKIIWARKSDKIKNDLDYDAKQMNLIKSKINEETLKEIDGSIQRSKFSSINKFHKYDSIVDIKNKVKLN
jgi:putative methyltransferase